MKTHQRERCWHTCSKACDLHPSTQAPPAALYWLHKTSPYEYLTNNSCNANSSSAPSTPNPYPPPTATTPTPIIPHVLQMLGPRLDIYEFKIAGGGTRVWGPKKQVKASGHHFDMLDWNLANKSDTQRVIKKRENKVSNYLLCRVESTGESTNITN